VHRTQPAGSQHERIKWAERQPAQNVKFNLQHFLLEIAPQAICADCIRDRMPISQRPLIQGLIDNLEATTFEHSQGECVACSRPASVIRHTS